MEKVMIMKYYLEAAFSNTEAPYADLILSMSVIKKILIQSNIYEKDSIKKKGRSQAFVLFCISLICLFLGV